MEVEKEKWPRGLAWPASQVEQRVVLTAAEEAAATAAAAARAPP